MQNTPKISIVIPVYNTGQYLAECLSSVLAQTYANMEIICVNDGSTDKSENILRDFAERDRRIKIISQRNMGVAVARNVGLASANGKYIYFVDSDDTIVPDLCEHCLQAAEAVDCDMVMLAFDEYEVKQIQELNLASDKALQCYNTKCLLLKFTLNPFRFFFKREFLQTNKIQFPELRVCEDMVFNIKAIVFAERIRLLNEQLYNYRIHEGSTTSPASMKKNKTRFDVFLFHREVKFLFDKQEYLPCLSYVYDRVIYPTLSDFYFQLSREDQKQWKLKFDNITDKRDIQYLKTSKSLGASPFHRIYYWHFYRLFWGNRLQRTISWIVVKTMKSLRKVSFLKLFYRILRYGQNSIVVK